MSEEVKKRPVGRPSSYKPEYCEKVIELAKTGGSWAEIAAEFMVDRATLYDWADKHPDFSTALKIAKVLEQAWWEKEGKRGMQDNRINAAVWTKSMQARFRDDYTERREVTGADGGPIQQILTHTLDVSELDVEELEALEKALLATMGGTKQ
jgi:hypothetical protein